MFKSPGNDRIRKVCIALSAALVLPALAYAGTDNSQKNGNQNGQIPVVSQVLNQIQSVLTALDQQLNPPHTQGNVPVVPEANAGLVLAPLVGVVLLLSWRQLTRAKA